MNNLRRLTSLSIPVLACSMVVFTLANAAPAQEMPSDYQQVLKIVGKSGDYKSNVLKVNIPRNDLHMKIAGKAVDLANQLKPALGLIGLAKEGEENAAPKPVTKQGTTLDTEQIAKIVGHSGDQTGPVYKITLGRDDLNIKDMGATINARMGLNTWAAFVGTNNDAAIAGDIAMLENEVTPVLKALRSNGLNVVAIHHHMINTNPMIIFLHYWGRGPAEKLATGFKAAVDELGKANKQ